ncbi:pyridoxamine 5'-phosphate oxidase family protein [Clostridium beijerinckii]|uniref:pyridoxamine 5'-phosphate oxidase family protein n=1 Tax=Clostridium beijerinckii TaxID=1520 RepID=UPI0008099F19|nr:pyridoxamine 5'-phosphate oxidase family protein [Clostridium beijerinckii]OCA98693.1 hypothetical protein BGS1_11715 [Clostridium beijerinckii]
MGKEFKNITSKLEGFIEQQKFYFIGTTSTIKGEVHIAPKGYDTLKIIDSNNIICLDYFESEDDTAQNLVENNKVSIMWCSVDKKPCNLWAYGSGEVVYSGTSEFDSLLKQHFTNHSPSMIRHIIKIKIYKSMTACGFSIPFMKYEGKRDLLADSTCESISIFEKLTDEFEEFIENQKMFFVGTTPNNNSEVHIAPKGYKDSFQIVNENEVLYLDYYGSENNTAQHLTQNGRISLMWCDFGENPQIFRAQGHGEVISKDTIEFDTLLGQYFKSYHPKMVRQIFKIKVHRITNTKSLGIPLMKDEGERKTLHDVFDKMLVKNPAGKLFSKFFNSDI